MSGPNYQALTVAQPAITQRYTIDYETVGRVQDPWPVVDELISRVTDPRWSRARACWGCNNWTAVDGLAHLPFRPGAGSSAIQSCTSCHYAKLDEVSINPDVATDTLDAMKALRESWRAALSPRRPKMNRPRTLTLGSVQHQQGFTGKRSDRMKGTHDTVSSFRHKPNDINERIDCPWCGAKDGARVERYTRIQPARPGAGEERKTDQRFVAIHCLLTPCGRRIVQPEPDPFPVYKPEEEPKK